MRHGAECHFGAIKINKPTMTTNVETQNPSSPVRFVSFAHSLQTFVGQVNERASRSPDVNNPILAMGVSLPISWTGFSSLQVQHLKVVIGQFLSRALYFGGRFPVFKWFWFVNF